MPTYFTNEREKRSALGDNTLFLGRRVMIFSMKQLIKFTFLSLVLSPIISSVYAIDFIAVREIGMNRELQRETIVLNVGSLDGYVEGEHIHLFRQIGDKRFPKSLKLGEAELVKVFPKYSYWQILNTPLAEGAKIGLTEVGVIRSRMGINGRELDVKNKIRLLDRSHDERDFADLEKNELLESPEIPDNLRQDHSYKALKDETFEEKKLKRADVEVVKNDFLIKKSGTSFSSEHNEELSELYAPELKGKDPNIVKKETEKEISKAQADLYRKNQQRTKYGMDDFYKDQEKIPEMKDIRNKISTISVYDQEKEAKFEESMISNRALKKMQRDKALWSQDMDDKVLRRYFVQNGIASEYERRERALSELEGHEMWLRFYGGANRNTVDADPNFQRFNYAMAVGYNLHFSRINPEYVNWSMDFYGESSVSHFALNDNTNAESKELFAGTSLNYYFLNNPLTLNKFIGHVGLGMKLGQGEAIAADLNRTISYQLVTMPTLSGGIKYRFRAGDLTRDTANIGAALAFGAMYERVNYSAGEVLEASEIYGKFAVNTMKYYFGLHLYY